MSILSFSVGNAAQIGQVPRRNKLLTTDDFETITSPGYLNSSNTGGKQILPTDIFDVIYSYDRNTGVGFYSEFNVTFNSNNISLIQFPKPNTLSPVTPGNVPLFSNTSGELKDSGATLADPDYLYFVKFDGIANTPDFPMFIDVTGSIENSFILPANLMTRNVVNTLTSAGSIIWNKGTATSNSGAVTLDLPSGVITTESILVLPGGSYNLTLSNMYVLTSSVMLTGYIAGTNANSNITFSSVITNNGTVTITIYNNDSAISINGTLKIPFIIF